MPPQGGNFHASKVVFVGPQRARVMANSNCSTNSEAFSASSRIVRSSKFSARGKSSGRLGGILGFSCGGTI